MSGFYFKPGLTGVTEGRTVRMLLISGNVYNVSQSENDQTISMAIGN